MNLPFFSVQAETVSQVWRIVAMLRIRLSFFWLIVVRATCRTTGGISGRAGRISLP